MQPNGLLAWGGDLQPERLLNAYRRGIFPWYSDGEPIMWWSPAPRCVLVPGDVYLSRRTRRRYNSGRYSITADTAFEAVVEACAEPRRDVVNEPQPAIADDDNPDSGSHTWITAELQQGFLELHRMGLAHSVEVWVKDQLVGGVYGLAMGEMFFGESMFSRRPDASKLALVALCRQLQRWTFGLLDCQVPNDHLKSMGAVELDRGSFEGLLSVLVAETGQPGSWKQSFEVEPRW